MKPDLYLINGPLGAGKTTVLRELLKHKQLSDARIIENEFASVSVDTQQLHDHQAEIQTIAGVCICCSTGDELTDALTSLAVTSEPVIIEATGVANSLKLIEKLVVADMFETYNLAHTLFVLDAAEVAAHFDETIATYSNELQAADTVLITKSDLIDETEYQHIADTLAALGCRTVERAHEGQFDTTVLQTPSAMLAFFVDSDVVANNHDEATNYTVIDLSDTPLSEDQIRKAWELTRDTYGVQRIKGGYLTTTGQSGHIEATSQQCRLTTATSDQSPQIVLIGTDARSVTREIFLKATR